VHRFLSTPDRQRRRVKISPELSADWDITSPDRCARRDQGACVKPGLTAFAAAAREVVSALPIGTLRCGFVSVIFELTFKLRPLPQASATAAPSARSGTGTPIITMTRPSDSLINRFDQLGIAVTVNRSLLIRRANKIDIYQNAEPCSC
jgi:hypothetical protein